MKIIINRNKLMQIYTKKSDLPRKDVRKYHFNTIKWTNNNKIQLNVTIKLQLLNSHIANCITNIYNNNPYKNI